MNGDVVMFRKKVSEEEQKKRAERQKLLKKAKTGVDLAGVGLVALAGKSAYDYITTNQDYLGRPTRTTGRKLLGKAIKKLVFKR